MTNSRELSHYSRVLMKKLAVKADYVSKNSDGTSDYNSVQQMMTDFILLSAVRLKSYRDEDILVAFLKALVKAKRHTNLKKAMREILSIEVAPTELHLTNRILELLSKEPSTF